MDILFLIIGLIIGVVIGLLISKILLNKPNVENIKDKEFDDIKIKLAIYKSKLDDFIKTSEADKHSLDEKDFQIIELNKKISSKSTENENLLTKINESKEEYKNIQKEFQIQFKNLANEILEEKTKKFTSQNRDNLDEILKPLKEKISSFEKKVEETYDKESKERFSLKEEVKRLEELNQKISKEANNLATALKGESKTQGNWGEMILENILQQSGLVKNREYFPQSSYSGEDGNRLQPDVVIKYPEDKSVVVDSKVSLTAYETYVSSESKDEKELAIKAHMISLKKHIKELSDKNYQNIYDLNSLDFVMMFIPIEPAYLLAIQNDSDLWNFAYKLRVLLISPTNLIAALKMISSMWKQEYQSKNVMEIARQSGDLYDKFVGLVNDLIDIGKKLDQTQDSYKKSMNKLSEGKGNLISRVEKIKKLGVKTKNSIPEKLIDRAIE